MSYVLACTAFLLLVACATAVAAVFSYWRHRRAERAAETAIDQQLAQVASQPVPQLLAARPPRSVAARGGYLDAGLEAERPRYRALLEQGVPTTGLVLELTESRHQRLVGYRWKWAFRLPSGEVKVMSESDEYDLDLIAFENRRGKLKPAWDLRLKTGSTFTVLVDPRSGDALIYDALMLD
ncbi:MAG: hypothetical protein SFW67_21785 [Myxococcaceae bacterium]|nr:hypothetical protein [Myxococcaceae bacterium]